MRVRTEVVGWWRSRPTLRTGVRELLIVAVLFSIYKAVRLLANDADVVAVANAWRLLEWQQALYLPGEQTLQGLMLTSDAVTSAANSYYAWMHFPLTVAFLIWLFVRHQERYVLVRTQLALLTGLAMVVHIAFPLAPPRMLAEAGFIDTAAVYGPTVYGSPGADSVANQFAAMPSLHFGWSLVVAIGVIRVWRSCWRWLWFAHPAVTLAVIVTTGNHYWLDAAVAALLLVVAHWAVRSYAELSLPSGLAGFRVTARVPPAVAHRADDCRFADWIASVVFAGRAPGDGCRVGGPRSASGRAGRRRPGTLPHPGLRGVGLVTPLEAASLDRCVGPRG